MCNVGICFVQLEEIIFFIGQECILICQIQLILIVYYSDQNDGLLVIIIIILVCIFYDFCNYCKVWFLYDYR